MCWEGRDIPEIAFEPKHQLTPFQRRDAAQALDVPHEQPVLRRCICARWTRGVRGVSGWTKALANVRGFTWRTACIQRLETEHLRKGKGNGKGGGAGGAGGGLTDSVCMDTNDACGLRTLLLGPSPAHGPQAASAALDALNAVIAALILLVERVYPADPDELGCALDDFRYVHSLDGRTHAALACKRALVLIAIHMEPEVCAHFLAQSGKNAAFAADLRDRILPMLMPPYLRSLCQYPDNFVQMAVVLHEMWTGEDLGPMHLSLGA